MTQQRDFFLEIKKFLHRLIHNIVMYKYADAVMYRNMVPSYHEHILEWMNVLLNK